MKKSVLVFDLDGVLADVTGSYLAAIAATVLHFTRKAVSHDLIAGYKNEGGWNNDWALAQKIIFDTAKLDVAYADVVEVFQANFLGANNDGLIMRETWIPRDGLLTRLAEKYALAIFSGRPRVEIDITLARFASEIQWVSIVADMDVPKPKPAPDGLRAIASTHPDRTLIYVGDNVDDARSARAAGVRFIGITDGNEQLAALLIGEGASAVIANVNELESLNLESVLK